MCVRRSMVQAESALICAQRFAVASHLPCTCADAQVGEMYYDHELKMWMERGRSAPQQASPQTIQAHHQQYAAQQSAAQQGQVRAEAAQSAQLPSASAIAAAADG